MDTDTDQTSEQTTEAVPEVTQSEGVETSSSNESEETPDTSVEETKPAYVPDYKLKVYDEEKELDDPFLKNLIKDADSEKKVKEIAQKYLGFETVKQRNEKLKSEFQAYQQAAAPKAEVYDNATKYLQKGDLDSFFGYLNIPDEVIFRYAVKKAEEANLAPEQRMQLQQQRQIAQQRDYLESQNQTLMQRQQEQLSQFRAQELNWVLSRPDVTSAAQSFDQRVGQPGAFRQAVIDKGLAHYAATGQDLSAEQATQEVMRLVGVTTPQVTPQATIKQEAPPPIIPHVTGKGASPVRKQVRSIADLKQKRDELRSSS